MAGRCAIYGANGFGREVLATLRRASGAPTDIVFVDDDASAEGLPGVTVLAFQALAADPRPVVLAVADPAARARLAARCRQAGLAFRSVIAATAVIGERVRLGQGAIVCDHATITADATIGDHVHLNIYSYVAHDCIVGDCVSLAPRVSLNGRVTVGDRAYLGTGAMVRQGRPGQPVRIGADAVVGMGAVVLSDVADGTTVVGNPARRLASRANENR